MILFLGLGGGRNMAIGEKEVIFIHKFPLHPRMSYEKLQSDFN
jgi:hypothetical protein